MSTRSTPSRLLLAAALTALAATYAHWFLGSAHFGAALLVFVAPVALLLGLVLAGSAKGVFWAGVFGLFWFSHAVMIAWAEPDERLHALLATALSVTIVFASSWSGLRARFGGGRRRSG